MDMNMGFMGRVAGSLVMLLAAQTAAAGLFDVVKDLKKKVGLGGPEYEINIEHPPIRPLKVAKVAIAKPEGECSEGVASRVEEDFVQAGLTVIDRQQLAAVIAEHKLQVGPMIDQKTAAKVGALVGAQALVFVKVMDCRTTKSKQKLFSSAESGTVYKHTVNGMINGSLRVVNLTSGQVVAAQRFEGTGELESDEGFPDPVLALGDAEKNAAFSIHKVLLPWTETKRVVFYSDSQCDLKTASNLLKAQDLDGALKQSETNLATCREQPKVKPGTVARAYYNLGILQFMREDYEPALSNLTEAQKLNSSDVYISTIADCRKARELAALMEKYENDQAAMASGGR
jgi:hypothetical protein